MAKKLSAGDVVICRYFNKADNRFYGLSFIATVVEKSKNEPNYNPPREYVVRRESDKTLITVWRKEIMSRLLPALDK